MQALLLSLGTANGLGGALSLSSAMSSTCAEWKCTSHTQQPHVGKATREK